MLQIQSGKRLLCHDAKEQTKMDDICWYASQSAAILSNYIGLVPELFSTRYYSVLLSVQSGLELGAGEGFE